MSIAPAAAHSSSLHRPHPQPHATVWAQARRDIPFPGVLVASHAPFAWGATVEKAVENAVVLEYRVRLASETLRIAAGVEPMQQELLDKHFLRKHGPGACYGRKT